MEQPNAILNKSVSDEHESSEIDRTLPDGIETGDPERPHGCSLCRFELLIKILK